ncbi:MAG: hypothetical protein ACE5JI_17980 [Acidobacteriota bacterium]
MISNALSVITEPMTMATDYLLAVWSAVLAGALLRRAQSLGRRWARLWVVAFLVMAVAALAGGTAHGLRAYLGEARRALVWDITVWCIGLSVFLMLGAVVRSIRRPDALLVAQRQAGARWLMEGGLITFIGLVIQQSGWALHEHFNHNDIYHLVQIVGIYFLYRGALLLHDLED